MQIPGQVDRRSWALSLPRFPPVPRLPAGGLDTVEHSRDGLALKIRLSEGATGEHDPYADMYGGGANEER